MVLATGGGIVSEPLTFDLILSSFYTIWLKAEPEAHMARARRQGDLRPMADDRSAIGAAHHPAQPRTALRPRRRRGRYRGANGGQRRRAADRHGGAGAVVGCAGVRAAWRRRREV